MTTITLRPEHGYVLGSLVASYVVHHLYMPIKVSLARKAYGVKYPTLYASKSECKDADKFNCVQRGHQNSLERVDFNNLLMLTAGLRFPLTAAIAGAVYSLGRILYFEGYATGDPNKRHPGSALGYLGHYTLFGAVIRFAIQLIRA